MSVNDMHKRGQKMVIVKMRFVEAMLFALVLAWTASCTTTRESVSRAPPIDRERPQDLREAFEGLQGSDESGMANVITDNAEAWAIRWKMIEGARESIDVATFILGPDVIGRATVAQLLKKADDGVKVRLLIDGRGSLSFLLPTAGRGILHELARHENATVHVYNRAHIAIFSAFTQFSPVPAVASTHDKILVVDRRLAITGGRNLAREYFAKPQDMPNAFYDTEILVHGADVVRGLLEIFEDEFEQAKSGNVQPLGGSSQKHREELSQTYKEMNAWLSGESAVVEKTLAANPAWGGILQVEPTQLHESELSVLWKSSEVGDRQDSINHAIFRLVDGAQRKIVIQTPYFILTKDGVRLLEEAAARGVEIHVFTNSPVSSDSPISQALFVESWPELMARVPTMRLFVTGRARVMHAKRAVFDDEATLIGSYNLDLLSMRINSEVAVGVWSKGFAAQNLAEMEQALSENDTLEYRIQRDEAGNPVRYPDDHPHAGKVQVAFGPADHCPKEYKERRRLLSLVKSAKGLLSIQPAFW